MSATEIEIETETGITARSPGIIGIGISLRASQSETPKDVRLASSPRGTPLDLLLACVHGATTVAVCSSNSFSLQSHFPTRHHCDLPVHACNRTSVARCLGRLGSWPADHHVTLLATQLSLECCTALPSGAMPFGLHADHEHAGHGIMCPPLTGCHAMWQGTACHACASASFQQLLQLAGGLSSLRTLPTSCLLPASCHATLQGGATTGLGRARGSTPGGLASLQGTRPQWWR